jgi:hypothetical protein
VNVGFANSSWGGWIACRDEDDGPAHQKARGCSLEAKAGGPPVSDRTLEEVRDRWNLLADDWRTQIGRDGDSSLDPSVGLTREVASLLAGRRATMPSGRACTGPDEH